MDAYDYKAQRWATGEAARVLRLAQVREEIALLESPRGLDYFDYIATSATRAAGRDAFVAKMRALATHLTAGA